MPDASLRRGPQTAAFPLLLGHLETLSAPEALDTLVVDVEAIVPEKPRHAGCAVSRVKLRDPVHGLYHLLFAKVRMGPVAFPLKSATKIAVRLATPANQWRPPFGLLCHQEI